MTTHEPCKYWGISHHRVCGNIKLFCGKYIGLFCTRVGTHEPCKYWGICHRCVCGNNELFSGKHRALLRVCGSTRAVQILGYISSPCVWNNELFCGKYRVLWRVWKHTSRANIGVYLFTVCVEITSSSLGNIGLFCVCVEAHEPCKYWGISLHPAPFTDVDFMVQSVGSTV